MCIFFKKIIFYFIITVFVLGGIVFAGNIINSNSPVATFVTLDDIWNKINGIGTSTKSFNPLASPGPTMHTLSEIFEAVPILDASKILSGTSYMGISGNVILPPEDKVEEGYNYGPNGSLGGTLSPNVTLEWYFFDNPAGTVDWPTGDNYCYNLGWRLPSKDELVNKAQEVGNIGGPYWASDGDPDFIDNRYIVYGGGSVDTDDGGEGISYHLVRCVR